MCNIVDSFQHLRVLLFLATGVFATSSIATTNLAAEDASLEKEFPNIRQVLRKFCTDCHSARVMEGELDLERFSSAEKVRDDLKPWQAMIQQLETGEMPPKGETQPSDAQRSQLIEWSRAILKSEAMARAGDPGHVPLRRLSNTEYNNSIRDLTGIDLQPTRDFPADGAAGEGFTNAAEALTMSPALMGKYLIASKQIAAHAVLLPDGFRFSPSSTRRDWTDESLAELRNFYRQFADEGSLPLKPYIVALLENHDGLKSKTASLKEIGESRKLSPKYLDIIWQAMHRDQPQWPLDRVQSRWRIATIKNANGKVDEDAVDAIVAEVTQWFERLWEYPRIGSYVSDFRQIAKDPAIRQSQTIMIKLSPAPGQNAVNLYLTARVIGRGKRNANVTFKNPRFTGADRATLLLRNYKDFGSQYEVDFAELFAKTESYLAASVVAANDTSASIERLAEEYQLDPGWLKRWIGVLDVEPVEKDATPRESGRTVPKIVLHLLDEVAPNPQVEAVTGWRAKGIDLPIVISNSSDKTEHVPGRMSPHSVSMHPTPTEFSAAVWTSPMTGRVRISGRVSDAHDSCGNGFAWWIEKQSMARSAVIAEGVVDLGKAIDIPVRELGIEAGDKIFLAIDARDANHVCDLTETALTITELGSSKGRVWDLAKDVADDIEVENPHDDSIGNKDIWSFAKGKSKDRPVGSLADTKVHPLLNRWRDAVSARDDQAIANESAKQLKNLLTGERPTEQDAESRALYDHLASMEGPLLKEIDIARLATPSAERDYGLAIEKFGVQPDGKPADPNSLVVPTGKVISLKLPATLFAAHQFEVDCELDADANDVAVQFQVLTEKPNDDAWDASNPFDASAPIIALDNGDGKTNLLSGLAQLRRIFPPNICYPHIIPLDEVVCLKTFHREDGPLIDLFLNDDQTEELERLWSEHRFITKFPVVENEYLPLFIGFVTQDQPKELLKLFEGKRATFKKWADDFESEFDAAAPKQIKQLLDFASRAYRRPLSDAETRSLQSLYQTMREKEVPHEEAFRSLLARVLISPSFLLHLEQAPLGADAKQVDDWELASRLSYFLWASVPDKELRALAADGRLQQPEVLAQQTARMLRDDRVRSLAIEFGTQSIHVRGFDKFNEKNETLFPNFDSSLRSAMYEESVLFFQNLFQNNRPVMELVDADYSFLNEQLASHYGIPDVDGEHWRRVGNVKQFGRGGVLGLASVQTKQAGASRTSPVLRGNWVVETLLGEKLPRPPPNVPLLPESEIGNDGLTMRKIVEKHVSDAQCASCHQRIDPYGLALEQFDPIGRRRERDLGGLPIDATAKLRDGTEFEGIDGLREYLIANKKETFVRLFYRRLLGYALGRSVSISDQLLIDKMVEESSGGDGGLEKAVIAIVQSPQFRMIRGADNTNESSTIKGEKK